MKLDLRPDEKRSLVELARNLIRIPSSSEDDDSIYQFTLEHLDKKGVDPFIPGIRNPLEHSRDLFNVYSRSGSGKGPKIMINCHLDTVSLKEGWFHPPFEAVEEEGRIYGLGAADMKGGCASAITAYTSFLERFPDHKGELFLSCVYGEESPQPLGTDTLLREYNFNDYDLIIITEPSPMLAINDHCTVHKKIHRSSFPVLIVGAEGRALFEIDFFGKASHASHPSQGINALHDAARVITELARFDLYSNIKMGRGHYVVLNIDGGDQSFTVPSHCRIFVNRQLTLGEDDRSVLKELKKIIRSLKIRSRYTIRKRFSPSPDLDYKPYLNETGKYIELFNNLLPERKVGRSRPRRCTFTSSSVGDFNLFGSRTKAPVLVFGPGGGNIHAPNEYVIIDDMVSTTEYLLQFLSEAFGDE
jgi:succinyl-diaminopimelate desuccinylase